VTTEIDNSSKKTIFEHPSPIQISSEDVLLMFTRLMIRDSRGQEFIGKDEPSARVEAKRIVVLEP
jgi:hypothetical protein